MQESDLKVEIEKLRHSRHVSIQRIAQLKQNIVEIESQESEAIREVDKLHSKYNS